jgi:hypothetical protein
MVMSQGFVIVLVAYEHIARRIERFMEWDACLVQVISWQVLGALKLHPLIFALYQLNADPLQELAEGVSGEEAIVPTPHGSVETL